MQDINAILETIGVTVPDDKKESFSKLFNENYKTIAEVQGKAKTNDELKAKLSDTLAQLSEATKTIDQVKSANDPEKLKELQSQIEAYQEQEKQRQASSAEEASRSSFQGDFNDLLGDRKFASKLVQEAVFEKAYALRKSNPDMSLNTILTEVTGDGSGIWANPQQDVHKMQPTSKNDTQGGDHIESMDDIASHDSDYLLAHMDEVNAVLKNQ